MFIYNILQDVLHLANSKQKEILYKKQVMHNKNDKNDKNINENNAIGLLKEKLVKIMMIVNDTIRVNEYTKLITEMLKYISEVRPEKPSNVRIKNLSNKYSCNLKPSF